MFRLLYLLITLIIIQPALSQENDYQVEQFLFDCMQESFAKKDVNLIAELDRFENYLITKGDLKEASGKAFFDIFLEIQSDNDVLIFIPYSEFSELRSVSPQEFYSDKCLEDLRKMNSSDLKGSKYFEMSRALSSINREMVTPEKVAEAVSGVLVPTDFDNSYYRALTLLTVLNLSLEKPFPNEEKRDFDESAYFTIPIFISGDDELFLFKEMIAQDDFEPQLTKQIEENPNYLIRLEFDRKSSYNLYTSIRKEIADILMKLSQEEAKTLFNKNYEQLSEEQKLQIEKIYPFRIKEIMVEK
ncbi:hypothetical protein [Algoriphagus marinus]|uniref:hypothetical protein n=1 Tax=Algoriphagus marinus TaxID=1925762 RepID=UPI00094BC442|nr:hypothetical protein [Algoriphagus marinus]